MTVKILVTGARGFVGARVMEALKREAGVVAIAAPSLRGVDRDGIRRLIDRAEPDAIVHTAAISDIPTCAANPEASYRANVEIPVWIAETGVKCALFSTDQVYGGAPGEGPYAEGDEALVNLYARHKLEMERAVLDVNPDAVLLRATWMYDMPLYGAANRPNFLTLMLGRDALRFSATARRAVTYVREVAAWMPRALTLPGGVYHYGSASDMTMLDTARYLAALLRLRVELSDSGPDHDLWMNCEKIRTGGICFNTTAEGLKRCIADYGLDQ